MANKQYLKKILDEYSYADAAKVAYTQVHETLELYPDQKAKLENAKDLLFETPQNDKLLLSILAEVSERIGIPKNTVNFYAFITATERLVACYREMNIPESVIHSILRDFKVKDEECFMYTGIHGSFSDGWLVGWFKRDRFAFGRLQFNIGALTYPEITVGGKTFREGDKIICIHIPRLPDPFTPEARLESYKGAYEFFKDCFNDKEIPFTCNSWLLHPYNKEVLKPTANVVTFLEEFKPMRTYDGEVWIRFIFGKLYTGNPDDLPEESSLHRGYKKYLKEGGKTGSGYGIFLFDGENIINN